MAEHRHYHAQPERASPLVLRAQRVTPQAVLECAQATVVDGLCVGAVGLAGAKQ